MLTTNGFKIHFQHMDKGVKNRGTLCYIRKQDDPADTEPTVGLAKVNKADVYDKEKGRKIALSRAMDNTGISKELRTAIWQDYRVMKEGGRW